MLKLLLPMIPIRKSLLVILFATLTFVTALFAFINYELRKSLDGVRNTIAADAGKPKCHRYGLSQLANQYLENLHGIEIGASTQNSFRLKEGWAYCDTDDHHHWSAWRTGDFVELVKRLKFNIVAIQDVDDKVGNGFTVVVRK